MNQCGDSSTVEHEVHQLQDEGSIPISSLQVKPRDLVVTPCTLSEIRDFIETYHYSKNVNGVKSSYCFKITYHGILVGGVLFGEMSTTAWKRFADSEKKVLELRRLVLLDSAIKNSENRVIGFCLRYIKKVAYHVEVIVSYADPLYNHEGIIYQASNFEYFGLSGKDKGFIDVETGKHYHSRSLRVKYKGEFKPFAKKLREKLANGQLVPIVLPQKHCYIYKVKNAKKSLH